MPGDLRGKSVTVMGLGRFGGGAGVTRWLVEQGAKVLLTDLMTAERLGDGLRDVDDLVTSGAVRLGLGGHDETDFTGCDLVVANPAVPRPWANAYLGAATERGVPVTTEIRLLLERVDRRRVIGVTGTAGKSTTAAMIARLLAGAGHRCTLGGNLGGSLLGELATIADGWIVLELSSFMLHWLRAGSGDPAAAGISPHIAVLTNVAPNHLDWHGDVEHYRRCKQVIFEYQQPGDHRVEATDAAGIEPPPLRVPGEHNRRNAALAIAAARRAVEIDDETAATALAQYEGLPHRLQLIAERDDVRFYDDSKSTTPEATALAVAAFDAPRSVHLIAGGYDKGASLAPIAALAPSLAGLYTIGATGRQLAAAAGPAAPAFFCETLDRAVDRAIPAMRDGAVLLLSPGCASWDQFESYEERGRAFQRLVHHHLCGAT